MKLHFHSNTRKFSDTTTPLNEMIEEFVTLLDSIAIGIAEISSISRDLVADPKLVPSVASRLIFQSSKFDLLMQRVTATHTEIEKINSAISQNLLIQYKDYQDSRDAVNDSASTVENSINRAANRINDGPTYKEAYYQMTKVTIAYAGLVKEFNSAVASYNKIHSTNLIGARTDLSFFRLKPDVL